MEGVPHYRVTQNMFNSKTDRSANQVIRKPTNFMDLDEDIRRIVGQKVSPTISLVLSVTDGHGFSKMRHKVSCAQVTAHGIAVSICARNFLHRLAVCVSTSSLKLRQLRRCINRYDLSLILRSFVQELPKESWIKWVNEAWPELRAYLLCQEIRYPKDQFWLFQKG